MTWNYRVVQQYCSHLESYQYRIHSVYYSDDGSIESMSVCEVSPYGESVVDLISDYAKMAEAFKKPVIDYETREEINI